MATVIANKSAPKVTADSDLKDNGATSEHLHPIVGDRVIEGDGTSQDDWQLKIRTRDTPLLCGRK